MRDMEIGGLYRFKDTPETLVYIGRNWSGNGYWHQFELAAQRGNVWAELQSHDLHLIEKLTINGEPQSEIDRLSAEVDDLVEALSDVLVNRGPRPDETTCGCPFVCICPDERARAAIAKHKEKQG